jgi:hypothetical protein
MPEERSPRPADVDPEDATPSEGGAPGGAPAPFEGVDEDVTSPEERIEERAKRERDG